MAVEIEQLGQIRVIKMAGQASTQSFSMAFLPTIAEAIDDGLKHADTKAIVLTGDGRFFSAGADINAFQTSIESNTAPELIRNLTGVLHPLLQRMRTSSTIVVAALNGVSAGGGLGLALACD
ncbi:MAG: enoyl-CoA hydratase/isomerase family protein, partial [Candidatus Poseidonia sp.]|nr:enoyl-CoA hydratase/isomerase family protein [Poseidonia sp.]